jgi:hypothetical protein
MRTRGAIPGANLRSARLLSPPASAVRRLRLHLPLTTACLIGGACAQDVRFDRDVLPILSDRCFACHGPDGEAREAGLRLDLREAVVAESDGPVVPGSRERSLVWRRVTSTDPDQVMPPPGSGLRLDEREIATLGAWIDAGAPWSAHWAFDAPAAAPPPAAAAGGWVRNGIDHFVLARLEAAGLQPGPPADPAALLRRVHLDLTGLPPTLAQIDAFVRDPSDAAYAQVVEDLLASPHYGERMAWPWLEAGRYADTDGYQADPTRTAWPWRDHLVRALNANQPFDQFTVEALAGDLLPDATAEQRLATGLLRNNAHNGEGGRIPEETRIENVFDRTEMVGTVWLGLTLECARCHDHKYDPISQRDYYRLFAFFDQTSETGQGRSGGVLAPAMRYLPPEDRRRLAGLDAEISAREAALVAADPDLDAAQARFEREEGLALRAAAAAFVPSTLGPWQQSRAFGPDDGEATTMFAARYAPERGDEAGAGWSDQPALRDGEVLALPTGRFAVYFRRSIDCATARRMQLGLGSDDAIKVWCNGEQVLATDVRRAVAADQERAELRLVAGRNELLVKIVNTGGAGGVFCRPVAETPGDLPAEVSRALLAAPEVRAPETRDLLLRFFRRGRAAGFAAREAAVAALRAERETLLGASLQVSVMDQLPVDRRRSTRVLARGNYQTPGEVVGAGTPSFLPPLRAAGDRPDRLDLARWLVSGEHPLTARVAVNRAWQTLFGRGLVATPEDFGRQGERPTHPELLDWLARRFVASGWDLKALHRLIVQSATYRQAAVASPQSLAVDPRNDLIGRSPRPRLPAWMLRDQALALSGRLVTGVGGAPVRPYQPTGIWDEATFGAIKYRQDQGDALYRRSLYVFWRRIVGPTFLFDTPARLTCTVRPTATNTPLHALTTLNETGFVEAARGIAERAASVAVDPARRLRWMFRAATAREPRTAELAVLVDRLAACRSAFAADEARAAALLAVGAAPVPGGTTEPELAALTVVASLILNLDEVLCRP